MDFLFVRINARDISVLYIPRFVDDVIFIYFLLIYSFLLTLYFFYLSSLFVNKSIVFFTLPIAINTILTFNIITQGNANPTFYQWFIKNGKVASILTALACADIATLNIL